MKLQDEMIGFAKKALGLCDSVPVELLPLERRGSDRSFFRLKWKPKNSAILMRYDPKRIENCYYADIARFLNAISVPVPRLIEHDPIRCLILIEDLGEKDLWSFRKSSWKTRQPLYEKTLALAHRLHSFPLKDFPSDRVALMNGFGQDLYRWEREYFRDHFVRDVCRIELEALFDGELEVELSALAERLGGLKRSLIHRDLQSRNVMIWKAGPFFIDFQGMRFGNPFYDLGSLLCDPYVAFSDDEREELLLFYYRLSGMKLDWNAFRKAFWEASAQRLMQALGAFGFLTVKKGLASFLDHIPAGVQNLRHAAFQARSLPRLTSLIEKCGAIVEKSMMSPRSEGE